jgi:hypothetical protein
MYRSPLRILMLKPQEVVQAQALKYIAAPAPEVEADQIPQCTSGTWKIHRHTTVLPP